MRCSALFVLLIAAAACLVAHADDVEEIHLAFTPNGVAVSFYTSSALSAPAPSVNYGLFPNFLNGTATGSSSTYGQGYFHDVVISGLQPATTYYYVVNQDSNGTIYSFVTGRVPGDATPFSIIVVGDMGLANSQNTMAQLRSQLNQTDWILHIGDISYADDYFLRGDTYEGSWNKWMTEMEDITAVKPYMVLPGNHECTCTEVTPFLCPSDEKNFTAYRYRFRMPFAESNATNNMWYSFDYGLVHFIQISTETDFPSAPEGPGTYLDGGPFGPQLAWLEADLEAVSSPERRAKTPWVIVSGHRPIYSSGGGCNECLNAFEGLFNKYGVDLYFSGHVHWYERCYAIAPGGKVVSTNYVNPTAPVYIVNGAAGNVEGHADGTQQPFTALIDNSDFGFGRLSVYNSTTLNWQFFRSTDASLVDEVTIVKDTH